MQNRCGGSLADISTVSFSKTDGFTLTAGYMGDPLFIKERVGFQPEF
jgi:hypothetical protein